MYMYRYMSCMRWGTLRSVHIPFVHAQMHTIQAYTCTLSPMQASLELSIPENVQDMEIRDLNYYNGNL